MRSRLSRRSLPLAVAGSLAASMAVAAAAPPAAASPAARTPAAARTGMSGPPGGVRPVLLITGLRLAVRPGPGGRPVTALIPPASPAPAGRTAILTMGQPGRLSQVPADAVPFLGRGLDPGLFSVAALRRAEHGGRLPVRITYRERVPSLPGVTITHAAAGEAEGFLTARSALRFGAALHRQNLASHGRAVSGTGGLFGHGVSVALADAAVPPPARPRFVMRTLTVHATSLAGRPDDGDVVFLFSADDVRRAVGRGAFRHGTARVSTPAGRYWAIGTFTNSTTSAFVFSRQFTVPASGPMPRVELAGQTATSHVRVSTPRPALVDQASFIAVLRGRTGPPTAFGLTAIGAPGEDPGIAVAPADLGPGTGHHLQTFTQLQLASPRGARPPYQYNLDFPGPPGRIPAQQHQVQPSSLVTVTENLSQDQPSAALWGTVGGTVPELEAGAFSGLEPQRLPGRRIQYLTADPSVVWANQYVAFGKSFTGGQTGPLRAYRPGEAVTEDWGQYPLHPAPMLGPDAGPPSRIVLVPPSAGRAGAALTLAVTPFSDGTPGHLGQPLAGPTGKRTVRYRVDQDGTRRASGDASNGIPPVRLSPGPSTVRFTLSARRTGPHFTLSPASTTTWRWRSQRDLSATVPPQWACLTGTRAHLALTRRCAVQPMLTLAYQVAGLAPDGSAPPGRQQISLTTGHIQLAAAPAIQAAGVAVSFDGGKTWTPAQVTPRSTAGRFTASFTAPAGTFVTLRTTAADGAGGSVTETITRAYRTAAIHAVTTAAVQRPAGQGGLIQPPCAQRRTGHAQCFLAYRPQRLAGPAAVPDAARPHGLSPAAIRSAYRLPAQQSSDQTVAVSIAFHTPHLARYLATYRKHYGLPPCTVASGCFRQVNQHGGTKPAPSGVATGWDLEATLDVSMISVACPRCHILVVEGNDSTPHDLAATERTAARLGAPVISNSYGGFEDGFSLPFRKAYQPRGRTVIASSGDSGFTDASFPADLPTVTAVGGTMLTRAHNRRGWRERVWQQPDGGAGGSGCSAWIAKPPWQHDTHCPMRTVADISAVADNIPVFSPTYSGWVTVAGTSVSAPLVAGIYGLAGNGTTMTTARLYRHRQAFFDITDGYNTFGPPRVICGGDYLCTAKKGYDAPTGLGTPNGPGGL